MNETIEVSFTKPEIESLLISLLLTSYFMDCTGVDDTCDPIMKRLLLTADKKGFQEFIQKAHGKMFVSDKILKKCMILLAKLKDEPTSSLDDQIIMAKENFEASLN